MDGAHAAAAVDRAASRPWRSKLRRLHDLTGWTRDLRQAPARGKRRARAAAARRSSRARGAVTAQTKRGWSQLARGERRVPRCKAAAPKCASAAAPRAEAEGEEEVAEDAEAAAAAAAKAARRAERRAARAATAQAEAAAPAAEEARQAAGGAKRARASEASEQPTKRQRPCLALALAAAPGKSGSPVRQERDRRPAPPPGPPPQVLKAAAVAEAAADAPAPAPAAPPQPLDARTEIDRILAAEAPEDILGVVEGAAEDELTKARRRLMLLLHPDKLRGLDGDGQEAGAEALNRVHAANDEMRRRLQQACAEVPAAPEASGAPRCMQSGPGSRKYEISWKLPETQNPASPVEKYEVWAPKYFSDRGEPFDWVQLATLPQLQSSFVLVEEAPTQQDCMWAADRVLRPTLPVCVHAVNGKGLSEALEFNLPWASAFPWLKGTPSVLCTSCFRVNPRRGRDGWTKCGGCGKGVPSESSLVLRCPECHGELLWAHGNSLGCSCCMREFGQAPPQARPPPQQPWEGRLKAPPQPPPQQGRAWGRGGGGGRGGRHW